MPLDAQIIEPVTGKIDPELSASLGVETHGLLFNHPEIRPDRFPLLSRISDFYSDADYQPAELESLIAELERAASLFGPDSVVCRFLGPFHSLCCLAFLRRKSVALYAD
jgi:hypothetical protein